MALWLRSLATFLTVIIGLSLSQLIFVSKNGYDSVDCGQQLENACGSFYYASVKLNETLSGTISIYDGQNPIEINKHYQTTETEIYHPCLPILFGSDKFGEYKLNHNIVNVTITFNNQYITKMDDWFMNGICYNNGKTFNYKNKYLFNMQNRANSANIPLTLTINNLQINNYDTNQTPFGIMFAVNNGQTSMNSVTCNNCQFDNVKFLNVWEYEYYQYEGLFMFGNVNLYLNMNIFSNVVSWNQLLSFPNGCESFTMVNTIIINSTFTNSMFFYGNSESGLCKPGFIDIFQSNFINIDANKSIINLNGFSTIDIYESKFENILNGGIIWAQVEYKPNLASININLNHIHVTTAQTYKEYDKYHQYLFYFDVGTVAVISNLNATFYYNITENCAWPTGGISYDPPTMWCNGSLGLIYNKQFTNISGNNSLNFITDDYFHAYINRSWMVNQDAYVIFNDIDGDMYVYNMIINGMPLSFSVFDSQGNMILHNVKMRLDMFNARMLQPTSIVDQASTKSTLYITDSVFIGGSLYTVSIFQAQIVHIIGSIIQYTNEAMDIGDILEEFVMNGSDIYKFGHLPSHSYNSVPVIISNTKSLMFFENTFSYYD
eukprot:169371_1